MYENNKAKIHTTTTIAYNNNNKTELEENNIMLNQNSHITHRFLQSNDRQYDGDSNKGIDQLCEYWPE